MFKDSEEMKRALLASSNAIALETRTLLRTMAEQGKGKDQNAMKLTWAFTAMEEQLLRLKEYEEWWICVKKEEENLKKGQKLLSELNGGV
jgi:hypothetical protein